MGFYDRDYYREPEPGRQYQFMRPKSMVITLILVNVIIFLLNEFTKSDPRDPGTINAFLWLRGTSLSDPWQWWRLLTYGFAHSGFAHIFGNMLTFFFLGTPVEQRYGQKEFLLFYLATIILGGLVWGLSNLGNHIPLLGASGGISGVVILMALNFPKMSVFLYGLIEMPMWVLGVLYVLLDTVGFFGGQGESNVAFSVHLTGAAFAVVYFLAGWNFSSIPGWFRGGRKRKPKKNLSLYQEDEDWLDAPDTNKDAEDAEKLALEIDEILKKISEKGKESLTWHERRTLKKASRDYQKKHGNK